MLMIRPYTVPMFCYAVWACVYANALLHTVLTAARLAHEGIEAWACMYADASLPPSAVRVVRGGTIADGYTVLTAARSAHDAVWACVYADALLHTCADSCTACSRGN